MQIPKYTQEDHVREDLSNRSIETTVRLAMPGIKSLHKRPLPEIAASLAAALKSQPNIIELRFVVGKYVEITIKEPE